MMLYWILWHWSNSPIIVWMQTVAIPNIFHDVVTYETKQCKFIWNFVKIFSLLFKLWGKSGLWELAETYGDIKKRIWNTYSTFRSAITFHINQSKSTCNFVTITSLVLNLCVKNLIWLGEKLKNESWVTFIFYF